MATSSITFSRVWRSMLVRQRIRTARLRRSSLSASSAVSPCSAVALVEQLGDLHFAGQRALAAHFGRMRGQYRAHQRLSKKALIAAGSAPARACAGRRSRASRGGGWSRRHMGAVAADVMLVFGDIG